MRILVDSLNLVLSTGTGIATYAGNFITNAAACGHEIDLILGNNWPYSRKPHQPVLLKEALAPAPRPRKICPPIQRLYGELRTCFAPRINDIPIIHEDNGLPVRHAWQVHQLYRNAMTAYKRFGRFTELDIPGIDVAHWTSTMPIRVRNAVNVYTIHDMIPVTHPEFVLGNNQLNKNLFQSIGNSADLIFTVSENSKKDIIKSLSCYADKVINTYQSIETDFWKVPSTTSAHLPANLVKNGYFLFFGAVEPKKNISRIIAAHCQSHTTLPLVLVASQGWGCDDVWKEIHNYACNGSGRCILLQYLPRADLVNIIAEAKSVVFPSLYEGFGLPVLEAMALGTPVIGSTVGSLPEVIGQAGLLVNPLDVQGLANAMDRMEYESGLADSLVHKGKLQADKFSNTAYRKRLSVALQSCAQRLQIRK